MHPRELTQVSIGRLQGTSKVPTTGTQEAGLPAQNGSLPAAHQRGSTHLACWGPQLRPPLSLTWPRLPSASEPPDTSPGCPHAALRVQLSLSATEQGQGHICQGRALRPHGSRAEVNRAVSKVTFCVREPVLGSQPRPEVRGQAVGAQTPTQPPMAGGLRGNRGRGYRKDEESLMDSTVSKKKKEPSTKQKDSPPHGRRYSQKIPPVRG